MINQYRINKIRNMIPKDVETILDVGSRGEVFKDFDTTTLDCIEEADINQDLNKTQKLNLPTDYYDLVVLNQILEHLSTVEEIIEESKRVSKRYILVGLPNESIYSFRLKMLLGIIEQEGYMPYGHKHRFTIKTIEQFVKTFFGQYEKKDFFGAFTGARFLPVFIKDFLAKNFPTLFAKEVYYLIDLKRSRFVW